MKKIFLVIVIIVAGTFFFKCATETLDSAKQQIELEFSGAGDQGLRQVFEGK